MAKEKSKSKTKEPKLTTAQIEALHYIAEVKLSTDMLAFYGFRVSTLNKLGALGYAEVVGVRSRKWILTKEGRARVKALRAGG